MTKLNLIECSLLEASGELPDATRQRLHIHLASHPRARQAFEQIEQEFNLLRTLPPVELTAGQRRMMAAAIKTGIHAKLRERARVKQAERRWKIVSYALSGLAAAAAVIVVGGVIMFDNSAATRQRAEQHARIEGATDRLAVYGDQASNPYDLAIKNVQASVTELQTEGPTLVAGLDNTEMSSVLNALTAPDFDDTQIDRP